MPRILIDNLDDPRTAVYRSLKATNQTRGLGQFVVEGQRLVERLLASRFPTASVLMTDRHASTSTLAVSDMVPVYIVPHQHIEALVGFSFHRGVLAAGERLPWPDVGPLLGDRGRRVFVAVCPRLSNPENLGALARIGDVFGIDAVLAGPQCPDPLSRRATRVSMGAVLRLPVLVMDDLEAAARRLVDESGLELFAAVAGPGAAPFETVERPHRLGLVLGDEHEGVGPEWLDLCHRAVTIPMRPGASSLNVAVAAGILIHHWTRDFLDRAATLPWGLEAPRQGQRGPCS